jgi:hypothetical protein
MDLTGIIPHFHNGQDSPRINANDIEGALGGFQLVYSKKNSSYLTNISVPVDIDKDGGFYKIFLSAQTLIGQEYQLGMRFNNNANNIYYGRAYHPVTGAQTRNAIDRIDIPYALTEGTHINCEATIYHRGGQFSQVFVNAVSAGNVTKIPDLEISAWNFATATNITDIEFYCQNNNAYSWEIRIYKLST